MQCARRSCSMPHTLDYDAKSWYRQNVRVAIVMTTGRAEKRSWRRCARKWIETSPVAYSMGPTVLVCTMYSVNVLAAKMTFMVFLRYIRSDFLLSLTQSRTLSFSLIGPFVSNAINTLGSNINDIGFRRTLNEFEHNVYLYWLSRHLVHFRLFSINVLNKSRY